ncbi:MULTISPECIES: hypothetical protein [unclassified Halomonas]|uniref:hypothetical protein n=1 Tax=unclassified Halomonas TaxID=2609666 RepID=UPI000990752A|nr:MULTISPECIES: hypothetical protein [unclassified Halomonas]AQU81894.1 hypothetical protein B2G49_04355 [Halomonas sp. 'Soap Lake \
MTLGVKKLYRRAYNHLWHRKVLKNHVNLPESQSIFTVYDLFPVNGVKVVHNSQPLLKEALLAKPSDSNLIHFLGAPFVERDRLKEFQYLNWLKGIRHQFPQDADFIYLLHPRESDAFGQKIKKNIGVEVKRFGLPYELELMRMEVKPTVIASWFCTALDNLSEANVDQIKLLSFKLPPFSKLRLKPNQKPIFDAAEDFYRRHSTPDSKVEVCEIPSLPQPVVPVVIEDPQKELARLVKVGGPLLRVVRLHPIEHAGAASPFVMLNPKETIAMGLRRLLGEYYGISPNLSQLPDGVLSFMDITDDVLQVRQNFAGKTLKRTALTFNIAVDGEKLIKFLSAENTFVYTSEETKPALGATSTYGQMLVPKPVPGAEVAATDEEPKPTLADLCTAIPECEQVFMPRSNLSGNAFKYLDTHTINYSKPHPFVFSIKISLVIEDGEGRVLMAERRSFPSRNQFDLPSMRVAPGLTLDSAFSKLTKDLLGSEMLRLQAQPIVGFEQLISYPEPHRKDEYILNFVYKIDVPNKYFVSMKTTAELTKHTWWEATTIKNMPVPIISTNALMALDFYADHTANRRSVEL